MPEGCDATEAATRSLVRGIYGDDLHRVLDTCLPLIRGTDYDRILFALKVREIAYMPYSPTLYVLVNMNCLSKQKQLQ